MIDGQEPQKTENSQQERFGRGMYRRSVFCLKIADFPKSRAGENPRKTPLLRNKGAERSLHENRAYEAGKDHRNLL